MSNQKKSRRNRNKKGKEAGLMDTKPYPAEAKANMELVIWRNPSRLDPFPQRYRTTMTTAIRGWIAAGTGPVTYVCKMNSVRIPFAGGGWPNALPAIATVNPTGHTSLCNVNFLQSFRVFSSRITFEIVPTSQSDTQLVTVTPSLVSITPANVTTALAMQFTKNKTVQVGQPAGSSIVSNKISNATLLGVPERAISDDLSGQAFGNYTADPTDLQWWVINIARLDAAVSVSQLYYRCIVQHDVEYEGDGSGLDLETVAAALHPLPRPVETAAPAQSKKPTSAEILDLYRESKVRELNL